MKRFLIAVDENGVYIRKTLCVTHHAENGEIQYDTKPVKKLPLWVIISVLIFILGKFEKKKPRSKK